MSRSTNSERDSKFEVRLRPKAESYIETLKTQAPRQARRCVEALSELGREPFRKRPKVDIKKWRDPRYDYRLRVGRHRFGYDVLKKEGFVDVKRAWFK